MNRHCAEAGTPVRSAHSDWGTILAIVVVCVLISVPAIAQKASMYDVEHVMSALESGEHSNLSEEQAIMFASELRFPDAGWLRLQFSDVHLNDGDFIRITSLSDGIEQIITDADPQLDDSAFDGRLISFIFDGGLVDIELSSAPGSAQAGFTVEELLVARGPQLGAVRAICGPTDDRLPFVDACCVRVVDSV
ncbi:hypothetical protein H8D73_01345, partial [bacterium]|nr:hypothetical protein [bacterium]